ncbi:hypothetical protein Tco_0920283 [Tanacetum coccineum]
MLKAMLKVCFLEQHPSSQATSSSCEYHSTRTIWDATLQLDYSKSGGWDQFGSNIATALVCLSTDRVYNFSKLIFDGGFESAPRPLLPSMLLVPTNPNAGQAHDVVAPSQPSSYTPPVPSTSSPPAHTYEESSPVHHHFSPPQEQASSQMPMDDLLEAVPKLITRIDSLEMDLKKTKLTMGNAIVKLVKKGRKSQDDPLASSVQGLVTPPTTKVASLKTRSIDKGRRYKRRKEYKGKKVVSSFDFQEGVDAGAEQVNTASVNAASVNTASGVNTGSIKLSTGDEKLSTADEKLNTGDEQVNVVDAEKPTSDQDKGQREGKAPMISEETPKKTKEQILQKEASLAEAIRLDTEQREEVARQKKRKAQVQFEAQHYTNEDWDLIRAKPEANAELSKSMLGSEAQGEDFAKKMVDLVNQRKSKDNVTQIWANGESFKDDQYILATQVKQVFYLEDMARRPPNWKVVEDANHKKFSNGGVIVVEDDHDVIHFDNSSDLALSLSLNDLDFATLHIDGQSIDVDAPPNIIDVNEDDDIIDEEDALPYDLADSDDEDLVNVHDDDDVVMSADVARGHGGDGGGDDHPPPHQIGGVEI